MSASLVGSEMCIRDRGLALAYRCRVNVRWLPALPRCAAKGGRPGVAPVSYTHLTLPTICSV
eukprot:2157636-Alexandrium_andersonii.AAC.1